VALIETVMNKLNGCWKN